MMARPAAPYELRIGRRYLRSTGNRFLSFISLISMVGVAIGVAVLIVVLSVMNGFERELRVPHPEPHLARDDHARSARGSPTGRRCAAVALGNPGVAAVAPFVERPRRC